MKLVSIVSVFVNSVSRLLYGMASAGEKNGKASVVKHRERGISYRKRPSSGRSR